MIEQTRNYSRLAFWGLIFLVALLLAAIHFPALNGEIRQSELQLFQNPLVAGVGIGSSPISPFIAQIGATGLSYYRPLTTISYRISYFLGGLDPLMHRFLNLLLVLLAAALIFKLLVLLTQDVPVAMAAVLLYIVHPVASAAASMVAGREELLLTIFLAWAWKLYLEHLPVESASTSWNKLLLISLVYLAALLSSEKAVLFLGLVLIGDLTLQAVRNSSSAPEPLSGLVKRRLFPAYAALLATTGIFFFWKYLVIGVRPWSLVGRVEALDNPLVGQSFMGSLANGLKLGGHYLSKSLWQVPPMAELYEYMPPASPADMILLLFAAFLILIALLAAIKFRQMPMAFLPVWIFGLDILPALNIFYRTPDAISDQHVVFPALGVALALAMFARYLRNRRGLNRLLLGGAGAVIVLFLGAVDMVHSARMTTEKGWMIALQSFDPYNIKLASKLAQSFRGTEQMPQAVKLLEEIVRVRPQSVQSRAELGRIKAIAGDLEGAKRSLTEAKALDPSNPEPCLALGNIYESQGQDPAAINEYETALKIQPQLSRALGLLGLVYQRARQPEKAIEYYQRALEINPGSGSSCLNLGATLAQQDRLPEALEYYQRALLLEPALAEAYLNLGSTYLRLGRQDEALAMFDSAVTLFSANPAVMLRAGLFYLQMRNYDKAAAIYKAALVSNPNDIQLHMSLGNTYRAAGDQAQAMAQYQKAQQLNPKSAEVYQGIGNIYSSGGNSTLALEAFSKAAEIAPDNPTAYFNIGNTYRALKKFPEAEAAYLKALQLQPDYPQACFNLASVYESLDKPREAILYFETFLKIWKGEATISDAAQGHIEQLRGKLPKP